MIGDAVHNMLSSFENTTAMVGNRVSAVVFREGEVFPAMNFNTQGMKKLGCRGEDNTKEGLLEIGLLANSARELQQLADNVTDNLDGYEGTHAGYYLSLEANADEFDEKVEDYKAVYKAIRFDLSATKL